MQQWPLLVRLGIQSVEDEKPPFKMPHALHENFQLLMNVTKDQQKWASRKLMYIALVLCLTLMEICFNVKLVINCSMPSVLVFSPSPTVMRNGASYLVSVRL